MKPSSRIASETSPKYAVAGFLYIRPMHGYELHKFFDFSLHEVWHISQSQTYTVVKNLEKEDWITITRQSQDKRPDREVLTLTELGKSEFERWLYTPTPGSARAIRVEFITRLFFASHTSEDLVLRLIQEQANDLRSDLDELRVRFEKVPDNQVYNRMGLDLRIRQLEAILNWIEDSAQFFEG